MSAHCHTCGTDLVYAGEWPQMECPVCVRDEWTARLGEAVRDFAQLLPPDRWHLLRPVTRGVLKALYPAVLEETRD